MHCKKLNNNKNKTIGYNLKTWFDYVSRGNRQLSWFSLPLRPLLPIFFLFFHFSVQKANIDTIRWSKCNFDYNPHLLCVCCCFCVNDRIECQIKRRREKWREKKINRKEIDEKKMREIRINRVNNRTKNVRLW